VLHVLGVLCAVRHYHNLVCSSLHSVNTEAFISRAKRQTDGRTEGLTVGVIRDTKHAQGKLIHAGNHLVLHLTFVRGNSAGFLYGFVTSVDSVQCNYFFIFEISEQ